MMTAAQIRQQFLGFFRSKGHEILPSAPIVVKNDPTLLFTNAGMNQFKDYFLGNKPPQFPRVANTQKCLRVSGKHNDLEEVGIDTYHHTMFEMLGNWSFGDPARPTSGYFKQEAIAWSWELLTEVYQLPKDRLYVTIFEGDTGEQLPKDEETYTEWKKWISEDRILLGKKKDNFWEMGDTGPCGPCTEIHVDSRTDEARKKVDGKTLVNADHPQVIEIWNNVFIQFNRRKDGSLEPLPARHVDTGMGLERLVRVLQGKQSNYDTDLFQNTIQATEKYCGKKYEGSGEKTDVAFRVIADHIRAICFAIADGQLPSNNGAGYVIRRILRRAVRYYFSYLDVKKPLLYGLVPVLAEQFEKVFPELQLQQDFVKKVVFEEESNFLRTLEGGIRRIEDFIKNAKAKSIDGKTAFELYDTYGFPLDLIHLIAKENGFSVDEKGFDTAMQQQKNRSRAASELDRDDWIEVIPHSGSSFVGYNHTEITTALSKYRKIKAKHKELYELVLATTPFYAESGGQVGDTGMLEFDGELITVVDTKKENDLIVHLTEQLPAKPTAPVRAKIDTVKRKSIASHHTATHLLHAALREVLGTHVQQKGSLVTADYLRFDFSHFSKLSEEELNRIEQIVNEKIRENIPVVIREMPKEEALQLGAMALFGEKYGTIVRVVIIDPTYSVELCGGTHVSSTGELGCFQLISETAVAAGVRRVEGVTGIKAEQYLNEQLQQLKNLKNILKNPKDVLKAVEQLIAEKAAAEKKLEQLEQQQLKALAQDLLQQTVSKNGIRFIGAVITLNSADALKKLLFDLKQQLDNNYAVVLAANIAGKAQVGILLDDAVVTTLGMEAPQIIKTHIAPLIKGGGGGQKTLATAGGLDVSQLPTVIERVSTLLDK